MTETLGSAPLNRETVQTKASFLIFPQKKSLGRHTESRNYTFGNTIKKLPKVPPGTANPILNEAKIIYKMNQWGEAPHTEKDGGKFIFLNIRGVNVSAVKIYENDDGPKLCDIETNPEYRQQGYAKELLRQVAELYGLKTFGIPEVSRPMDTTLLATWSSVPKRPELPPSPLQNLTTMSRSPLFSLGKIKRPDGTDKVDSSPFCPVIFHPASHFSEDGLSLQKAVGSVRNPYTRLGD